MTKLIFRGYNRVKFQSLKLGKTIFCKSLLIRDYLIHLEWDDNVSTFDLYPFKITYKLEGKKQTFSPHVILHKLDNESSVIWLKSFSPDEEERFQRRIKLISDVCSRRNFSFEIKSADDVRKEPLFSNLKLLRRYNRYEISINQIVMCNEFFNQSSVPFWGDLVDFFCCRNHPPQAAYALLAQKVIGADLELEPISKDLPIRQNNSFPTFSNGRLMR